MNSTKLLLALSASLLAVSMPAAHAATLTDPSGTLTLSSATLTAAPGSTVTFNATVTASATNSGALYLNGDAYQVNDPSQGLSLDDTDFFMDFPLTLNAGSSATDPLFTITVPTNEILGVYTGTFTLLGGSNSAATNSVATTTFTVNVAAASTAVTPEPASWLLLATGLFGIVALGSRGRFGAAQSRL